jgi:nucleolar protein 56
LKATIVTSVIGVLGFDEEGRIAARKVFPKDASKAAEKLASSEDGQIIDELAAVIKELRKKGFTTFSFENSKLSQAVKNRFNVEVEAAATSGATQKVRENLGQYAVETGFLSDASEISQWIHDVSMEMSKQRVKKAAEKRDLLVVQAVQALDDHDKTLNLFMGRVREWYGLHFPELDRLIDKHELYAQLVSNLGKKENFTLENLAKAEAPKNEAVQVARAAQASMGADLYEADLSQIQSMCRQALELYDARARLEKYIGELMEEVAPNTTAIAGATLGARMIALAGGLENLAKMPASTIQVLGAEKALFRSLTTGARPPKHGVIFQHALIHGSKRWLRGKIARVFAGKLAIAMRADAFSGGLISDRLNDELQKRVEELKKKYPASRPFGRKDRKPTGKPRSSKLRRKRHGRRV